jgi:hypothetical protein
VVDRYLVPVADGVTGAYDLRDTAARADNFPKIVVAARVLDAAGRLLLTATPFQKIRIELDLSPASPMRTPMIDIGFNNARGERIFMVSSNLSPTPLGGANGRTTASVTFEMPPLYPGRYEFDIGIMPVSGRYIDHITPAGMIEVLHDTYLQTSYPYFVEMGSILVPSRWETAPSRVAERETAKAI